MSDLSWIVIIALLVSVSCALSGTFLVLRRMAMIGDAMSHSILPGIVLAFLISGTRAPLPMFIGALSLGLATVVITHFLQKIGRLQEDASIGVTFTWLFALGVILVSAFAGKVDLDQECVLYGELAFAPWDRFTYGAYDLGPRAVWLTGGATLLNLLLLFFGHRRLTLISFDPTLAFTVGIRGQLWHFAQMTVVATTTVAAFESVGAILVVALLVIPANAAYLIASNVRAVIAGAVVSGMVSALLGVGAAAWFDVSIAGAVGVMSGIVFIVVAIVAWLINRPTKERSRKPEKAAPATPSL